MNNTTLCPEGTSNLNQDYITSSCVVNVRLQQGICSTCACLLGCICICCVWQFIRGITTYELNSRSTLRTTHKIRLAIIFMLGLSSAFGVGVVVLDSLQIRIYIHLWAQFVQLIAILCLFCFVDLYLFFIARLTMKFDLNKHRRNQTLRHIFVMFLVCYSCLFISLVTTTVISVIQQRFIYQVYWPIMSMYQGSEALIFLYWVRKILNHVQENEFQSKKKTRMVKNFKYNALVVMLATVFAVPLLLVLAVGTDFDWLLRGLICLCEAPVYSIILFMISEQKKTTESSHT